MDWFRGNSAENHGISHELGFFSGRFSIKEANPMRYDLLMAGGFSDMQSEVRTISTSDLVEATYGLKSVSVGTEIVRFY